MTGTLYSMGFDLYNIAHSFQTDLHPSWLFRHLPNGSSWYLLFKYRRDKFDSMLRKYLHRVRMEQLILPMLTVSVDLVEGEALVREAIRQSASSKASTFLPLRFL
jgi:NTE family protein